MRSETVSRGKAPAIWAARHTLVALLALVAGCGRGVDTPLDNYTTNIPGTGIEIDMVYVPGGEFDMGSPESEPGREKDEGPVCRVVVEPFWIGRTEVTWDAYERFAFVKDPLMLDAISLASPMINLTYGMKLWDWFGLQVRIGFDDELDAVTRPTPFEADYYHGMGRGRKPVIGISRLNAEMFCDWLSKKTGHQYRLPTEAEWEYAARAGSNSLYPFGNDERELDNYAWYEANSDFQTHPVGVKRPNAFGIHDMLGNAWEFCLDYYDPDYFGAFRNRGVNINPRGPGKGKNRKAVLRGGSWTDFAVDLRPANRLEQPGWWNERDPKRPRGIWWLVDGKTVGFRIARSAR